MTDNELVKSVKEYLNKSLYNYALMINGAWGCGKTYFVNNTLIPEIEQNYNCYYFSLYGIKNPQEITDGIFSQIVTDKIAKASNNRINPEGKGTRTALLLVSKASEWMFNKLSISSDGIKENLLDLLGNTSKDVYIFDDLERCSCNINDVLGHINTFVEHTDAKVIIICNEKEISQNPTAVDGLENDATDTTHNNSNEYFRIKEKVIGRTITYDPDLKKVFTEITKSVIKRSKLKKIILDKVDGFVSYVLDKDHRNLRTYQFFLEKVSCLFEVLGNRFSVLKPYIVENCFRSSVQHMAHLEMTEWKGDDFGWQPSGESFYSPRDMLSFKFVDNYITEGVLDIKAACDVLKRCEYIVQAEAKLGDDPVNKIRAWFYYEDDELSKMLNQIELNICEDCYSTVLYPKIIEALTSMLLFEIHMEEVKRVLSSMIEHLKEMPADRFVPFEREHFLRGNNNEQFDYYYEIITKNEKEKLDDHKKQHYKDLLKRPGNDWIKVISSEIVSNYYVSGKSYIYCLEPEAIFERLKSCTNKELDSFRSLIYITYEHVTYDDLNEDFPHLKELVRLINEMDKSGLGDVTKYAFGEIKKEIESKIELKSADQ